GMLLTVTLLFFSCSKDDGLKDDLINEKQVTVYIAGYTGGLNGPYKVKYWKNGELHELTDGTTKARATSIFIDKEDVYIAGSEVVEALGERAMYWKNGKKYALAGLDLGHSRASSIGVAKGKVYVAGVENARGIYWKDGTAHELPTTDDHLLSTNNVIYISDNQDVYIAGMFSNQTTQVVKYWKNDVEHIVTSPAAHAHGKVSSVFVNENDVYISGHYQTARGIGWAKYWINNVEHTLTDEVLAGRAH